MIPIFGTVCLSKQLVELKQNDISLNRILLVEIEEA